MARPPRPVGTPVLSRANWVRLCVQGFVMTVGALAAYQIGDSQGGPEVGATMLLTALSLSHLAVGLLARDQRNTIFDRAAVPGVAQWGICIGIAASLVVVEELIKLVLRQRDRRREATATPVPVSGA